MHKMAEIAHPLTTPGVPSGTSGKSSKKDIVGTRALGLGLGAVELEFWAWFCH